MEPDDLTKAEEEFGEIIKDGFADVLKRELPDRSQKELGDRINKFLRKQLIGSLATCHDSIPRSTTVRYSSDNLTIYVLTEGGGKLRNVRKNANVCFSVYGKYTGFRSCRGIQLWGTAEVISADEKDKYDQAMEKFKLGQREDLKKIDTQAMPKNMPIIRIEPERIRYLSIPEGVINEELKL